MATKTAVVVSSGGTTIFEQLQAGDTLAGVSAGPELVSGTTGGTGLTIGNPVYATSSGTYDKASASVISTAYVVGLASATTTMGAAMTFQHDDTITLTTGQWDAITGGAGGLSFNSTYYLDPTTAGRITATKPSTAGQCVVEIGYALSSTKMLLRISQPVLL